MNTGIFVRKLTFSDDTELELNSDSIVVITGPNNCGKSTVLNEINRSFDRVHRTKSALGPTLKDMSKSTKGKKKL